MLKLLAALVVLAGLAAAAALVPLHGRTVLDRWNAAPSAEAFARRGWAEALAALDGREAPAAKPARPTAPRQGPRPPAKPPIERYTEQDRQALDRIVAEHAR